MILLINFVKLLYKNHKKYVFFGELQVWVWLNSYVSGYYKLVLYRSKAKIECWRSECNHASEIVNNSLRKCEKLKNYKWPSLFVDLICGWILILLEQCSSTVVFQHICVLRESFYVTPNNLASKFLIKLKIFDNTN